MTGRRSGGIDEFELRFGVDVTDTPTSVDYINIGQIGGGGDYDSPWSAPIIWGDNSSQGVVARVMLALAIDQLDAAIDALSSSTNILLPNGSYLTGAEVKDLWSRMTFNVDGSVAVTPHSAGGTNDGNVIIATQAVLDYGLSPLGLLYIVLHELGHSTAGGVAMQDISFNTYRDSHGGSSAGYVGSVEFVTNEVYANQVALAVGQAIGINISSYGPPHGY